jgi:hypothetical protein
MADQQGHKPIPAPQDKQSQRLPQPRLAELSRTQAIGPLSTRGHYQGARRAMWAGRAKDTWWGWDGNMSIPAMTEQYLQDPDIEEALEIASFIQSW